MRAYAPWLAHFMTMMQARGEVADCAGWGTHDCLLMPQGGGGVGPPAAARPPQVTPMPHYTPLPP